MDRICQDCGAQCPPRQFSLGRCRRCYYRFRTGPTPPRRVMSLAERVDRYIAVDVHGCWIWQGYRNPGGYGVVGVGGGRTALVHRVQYERYIGPIPEGLQLDHLCRVRACCYPSHLEPVTAFENHRRSDETPAAIRRAKTHCKRGHEYTPENTYAAVDGRWRKCRACTLAANRRAYLARKAAKQVAA